jgi:F0F1-type ATP synthase epsilon subunit
MEVIIRTMLKDLYNGRAKEVILPGDDGEFSVWDFHQPCLYRLRQGLIKVKIGEGEEKFLIKTGIAKIDSDGLVAMVEI